MDRNGSRRRPEDGFTLIELLMTLVVVAVLSVIAIPQYIDYSNDAKKAVTNERLRAIKLAIVGDTSRVSEGVSLSPGFEFHCQRLPVELSQLVKAPGNDICVSPYDPFTKRGWRGPYLNAVDGWSQDAWGVDIDYNTDERYLRSCGPNGKCGDDDDIKLTF